MQQLAHLAQSTTLQSLLWNDCYSIHVCVTEKSTIKPYKIVSNSSDMALVLKIKKSFIKKDL